MADYIPWSIRQTLFRHRGTNIFQTQNPHWVLKDVEDTDRSIAELGVVLLLWRIPVRHSVELPRDIYRLYGRSPVSGWYALRHYDGHINTHSTFCQTHWRTIARHCIQFLQDFHRGLGLVHLDIKKQNILCDVSTATFVVADYEHADKPDLIPTRDYDQCHVWYYLALGAEYDSPLKSWRTDFMALGYVLASITATILGNPWTFDKEFWRCKDENTPVVVGTLPDTDLNRLVRLRECEINGAHPIVLEYLRRISTSVSWSQERPPPQAFYGELEELFFDMDILSVTPEPVEPSESNRMEEKFCPLPAKLDSPVIPPDILLQPI